VGEVFAVFFGAVFVNNFVLTRILGICPFLGVSKKISSALGMTGAMAFVLLMAGSVTWCVERWILGPRDLGYLRILVFILVIASLVQFVELAMIKFAPTLHRALGVYLPLITTNCVILYAALMNVQTPQFQNSFSAAIANAAGAAAGFGLALVIFAGIRERLDLANVPESFKGAPIALATASLLSLAFLGFSGFSI
jgi:electron transport complex protein RnfA